MAPARNNDAAVAEICNRVLDDLITIGKLVDTLSVFEQWEDQLERLYDTSQLVTSATALVLEIKSKI